MTTVNTPVGSHPDQATAPAGSFGHHLWAAVASTVVLTVIVGGIYPLIVWGLAQAVFPVKANGSLVKRDGTYTTKSEEAVGSAIIGQTFAAPIYFHPRPSAAGAGYDASASSGTNLGPLSVKLLNGIANDPATPDTDESYAGVKQLVAAYRSENGLADNAPVPADAVTRSGSGLDPHISPANAALQVARVAKARGVDVSVVQKLVDEFRESPDLGFMGESAVNVMRLNLALDARHPAATK